ncbi:MAG TPA: N-acetyl-gamma-glutamyl-phosphate reductase [Candidatus Acidoferrales bacterium]|nr:N-acetyl-gamma-glutamyl-phosphate reductase [Candidatus Acidoferrales bacterium]
MKSETGNNAVRIRVAIFGASGYAGYELYKILKRHNQAEIKYVTAETSAGKRLSEIFATADDTKIVRNEDVDLGQVDAVFLSLPHGAAKNVVEKIVDSSRRVKIIDLSADYRFDDAEEYAKWYGQKHTSPDFLDDFVYGLTEINREAIYKAQFVANPGCYPTATILGVYPLLKTKLADLSEPIIIDAKSGVTGAGRKVEARYLFAEVNENVSPYNIGYVHRHTGEIEQELKKAANTNVKIIFSPHLVPITRGMLNTIYVKLSQDIPTEELIHIFNKNYEDETFIRVLADNSIATFQHTINTNLCVISVKKVENSPYAIVVSSIDNLGKGAAGQAVQNFNVMCGLTESEGLI